MTKGYIVGIYVVIDVNYAWYNDHFWRNFEGPIVLKTPCHQSQFEEVYEPSNQGFEE